MQELISKERLTSYSSILKLSNEREILRAYYWNKALCASIYPALQCLEVSLRNAIDIAIKANPPLGGMYVVDDWWLHNLCEYLGDKKIKKAKRFDAGGNRIRFLWEEEQQKKVRKRLMSKSGNISPASIMAGLDFGYWTGMFGPDYEDSGSGTLLWPNLISKVFPNCPAGTDRHVIEAKLNRIRELRNRISHHEPIWKFYALKGNSNALDYTNPIYGLNASISILKKCFDEIIEIVSWISPDRERYLIDSNVCSSFRRLCSANGFNAYVHPHKLKSIKLIFPWIPWIHSWTKKLRPDEIVAIKGLNNKIVAVWGADMPLIDEI